MRRYGVMASEENGTGTTYQWDAGEVEAGRYEIGISQPIYSISLEVGPETSHVQLEIPPPGTVIVRAVMKLIFLTSFFPLLAWNCARIPRTSCFRSFLFSAMIGLPSWVAFHGIPNHGAAMGS